MTCYFCLQELTYKDFDTLVNSPGASKKIMSSLEQQYGKEAKSKFDRLAEVIASTFTPSCGHACHFKCFVTISSKFDNCGFCAASIKPHALESAKKLNEIAPLFVQLIGCGVRANEIAPLFVVLIGSAISADEYMEASQYLTQINGFEEVKKEVLTEFARGERSNQADILDFLLANGKFSNESKKAALSAATENKITEAIRLLNSSIEPENRGDGKVNHLAQSWRDDVDDDDDDDSLFGVDD